MPPRPAGTDGTDYSYREVIVDRYKRMAEYKDAIQKLMSLHLLCLLIKLGWCYAASQLGGDPVAAPVLGMAAGELLLHVIFRAAKMGSSKESLTLLKVFNVLQAFITATEVLSAWLYHQGTRTEGVPTHANAKAVGHYLAVTYPQYTPGNALDVLKAFDLFLDLTFSAFLVLSTYVSHKMIVEKMQMKAEKRSVSKHRKGAIKGGGDSDSEEDEDSDAAPDAVPVEEKPKVAKAAANSMRRRHA